MGKFYLQSGNASLMIAATDAKTAAIGLLYRAINQYFPIDEVELRLLNLSSLDCINRAIAELDSRISVSEIGFGRTDSGWFDREPLFTKWRGEIDSMAFLYNQPF